MAAFDKKQMDAIVSRFLAWKLPKTFSPDCWISFNLPKENFDKPGFWPVGTNLFTADEARAMLEHVLDVTFIPDWSLLEATQASLREHMAMVKELRAQLAAAGVPAVPHLSLCASQDDTMRGYPACDCGADHENATRAAGVAGTCQTFDQWVAERGREGLFSDSSPDPRINVARFAWDAALRAHGVQGLHTGQENDHD